MQTVMTNSVLVFLGGALVSGVVCAAGSVDLSKIDHLSPKGRVQDKVNNPQLPVIDALIAMGTQSIPLLIEMLGDDTEIDHQVIDYDPLLTVGETAFVILTDLTSDSTWSRSTIPGASRDEILLAPRRTQVC